MLPTAASTLLAPLLDGPPRLLEEVARTRLAVHYATGEPGLPVLCVAVPGAVLLPGTATVPFLPERGAIGVGQGILETSAAALRVTRWWRPPRPGGLAPPPGPTSTAEGTGSRAPGDPVPTAALTAAGLDPDLLLGYGPGLTPAGDDVLAAALVTARATGDPRLAGWRRATRAALARRSTTPVSLGMLHAALDGWCTPELDGYLRALCSPGPPGAGRLADAERRLLAVGHSSGAALLLGVRHTLATRDLRGAAA